MMTMKVLMVSRYVQPDIKFSNTNVCRQATSLKIDHRVEVEILTWPFNDQWTGPMPDRAAGLAIPPIQIESGDLTFHIINPPDEWNDRPIRPLCWDAAVDFGVRVLQALRPDIVHLQHWFGLCWILESAQRLGIPTVYSNHDWGMACLRTILVMGNNSLCDGRLSVEKCARCIWQGRGFIGKTNEFVVESALGQGLIEGIFRSPLKGMFKRHGAVRLPVRERVALNLARATKVLKKLDTMFTPSEFGRTFFAQLGVSEDRIKVQPWYHDPVRIRKTVTPLQPFTITYIGRVSPEKGVHMIFDALSRAVSMEPIHLRIAGANTSPYCTKLKRQHVSHVGPHKVEWLGWSEVAPLLLSTDVSIITSTWIDNTPLSLVEAFSYKVPVIATRVPPIEDLVTDGQNGYLADYNSVESLVSAIQRAVADKERIRSGILRFPKINTCSEYCRTVKDTYLKIAKSVN